MFYKRCRSISFYIIQGVLMQYEAPVYCDCATCTESTYVCTESLPVLWTEGAEQWRTVWVSEVSVTWSVKFSEKSKCYSQCFTKILSERSK